MEEKEVQFTIRFTKVPGGPVTCDLFADNDPEEEIASAIGDTFDEAISLLISQITFAETF